MFAATRQMEVAIRMSLIAAALFNAPTLEGEMKENTMQTVHKSGHWKHLVWPTGLLYDSLILFLRRSLRSTRPVRSKE